LSLAAASYAAFSDELTKIGLAKTVGKWINRGWSEVGGVSGKAVTRGGGWLGKQDTWRRNLPIGGKSIFTGLTAATLPSTLSKRDPLGKQRSRAERVTDLGADLVGGLAGAGAMLSLPGSRGKLTRGIVGGLGGSLLASRVATTPWRRARAQATQPVLPAAKRQQLLQQGRK
jgi:hypothetical protein